MRLKGSITISRATSSREPDSIHVRVIDEVAAVSFLDLKLTVEDFGNLISGRGYVPCELELRGLENLGKVYQSKTVLVPFTEETWSEAGKAEALKALAPYEVEGWRARVDDLFNHHRHRPDGIAVTFTRHVETV